MKDHDGYYQSMGKTKQFVGDLAKDKAFAKMVSCRTFHKEIIGIYLSREEDTGMFGFDGLLGIGIRENISIVV